MFRFLSLSVLLFLLQIHVFSDETYTWFSGKLKSPLLYADPEEFSSRLEVAIKNDRLALAYKIGQHLPLFTYENEIFSFGVGGVLHYAQQYLDVGSGKINLEREQLRSGGFIEASYSKLSLRVPIYYETNNLHLNNNDKNYIAVLSPSLHYELVPDFILYAGAKILLNTSLHNDKNRYQSGFLYSFGRGYFRPHFGLDYTIREDLKDNGRLALRLGSFLGRLDEFVIHSLYLQLELGMADLGYDTRKHNKIFSFNYSLTF